MSKPSETFHVLSDRTGDSHDAERPSLAAVRTIADHDGVDLTELPPLGRAVDPDALDAVLESPSKGGEPVSVSFQYAGYEVTLRSDAEVRFSESTDD
jgi:hypothetical protein